MAEEFLKDQGCSCCNGHHDEDEAVKMDAVGTCGCCGDDDDDEEESPLWTLVAGTVLFLVTYLAGIIPDDFSLPAYIIAYLLLGYGVLREAGENIMKRQPFDENFLMAVATIGAFAIGDYPEAVAVMLFSRIGEAMEDRAVNRSRKQVAAAIDMRPEVVHRVTADGSTVTIPAKDAAAGDVVVVRVGDRIPLDGVVMAGESLIDTSALTGEPVPVICREGSEVLSGSINTSGVLHVKVTKPLAESMVTKILESVERAAARKPKIDRFITRFSRIYTPAVVAIAAATAIIPSLVTGQWHYWIYTALTFLVISCPCALVISIPLSFFAGIGGASKAGVLVKGSNYLETLSQTGYVVFDKTGTLTQGVFEVVGIHHAAMEERKLLEYAALAESASSHPISKSLQKAYGKELDRSRVTEVQEISGHGVLAKVDGISVAAGNDKLMARLGIAAVPCHQVGTVIHLAVDGAYAGHILIADVVKPTAKAAMEALRGAGVEKTVMLTGDVRTVAQQVAEELGVDQVYSELLPGDKVAKVEEMLQQKPAKKKLAFVGDGINDAPVLSRADIGIAMGAMGSDAAIEAADVVLMDDDPMKIAKAIRISRKCLRIVYENIAFALGIKGLCLILGALGIANMWLAIFADVGVMILAVLNAIRALFVKRL